MASAHKEFVLHIYRMVVPKVHRLFEVPLQTCFWKQAMMKLVVSKLIYINSARDERYFHGIYCSIIEFKGLKSQFTAIRIKYNPVSCAHTSDFDIPDFGHSGNQLNKQLTHPTFIAKAAAVALTRYILD